MNEARRLRTLEHENTRVKRLVADLALDNQALKERVGKRSDAVTQRTAVRAIQTKFKLSELSSTIEQLVHTLRSAERR